MNERNESPCATCNGNGMIGGPSYSQPDEGGEPCPDCNSPAASTRTDALPVGQASNMPGTDGFTMVCFKASDVPAGTNLYTLPPMDEDADICLIARVFAEFRKDSCVPGDDRVSEAFFKAARVLMGAVNAPLTITDEMKERAYDAVAEALGDAYDCDRVWSAWSVGTMRQDDFYPVADSSERVVEIADAAIAAILASTGAKP
ncbi:hypothetical protein [Caballeronia sp. KNU42]